MLLFRILKRIIEIVVLTPYPLGTRFNRFGFLTMMEEAGSGGQEFPTG